MARTTSTNFTGANSFPIANATTDPFVRTDVQQLAAAVDVHDHTAGKGVVVAGGVALISAQTLGATAATVTFSSIPGTYRNLRLAVVARGDTSNNQVDLLMRVNGDTGANYDAYVEQANSANAGNGSASSGVGMAQTIAAIGELAAATGPANQPGIMNLWIPAYAQTVFLKSWRGSGYWRLDNTTASSVRRCDAMGNWRSTAAITSLTLSLGAGSFIAGSTFALYGEI